MSTNIHPTRVNILARRVVRWPLLAIFALGVLWADYATGPTIIFLAWLVLVIVLSAWYDGYGVALALAICLPLVRLGFEFIWPYVPWPRMDSYINCALRIMSMCVLAFLVGRISHLVREVRILRGLLPICMYCHRMRSPDGDWKRLETFLTEHSEVSLSHGICPECSNHPSPS